MVKVMVSTVNLGLTIPCWTYQQLASWLNQVANNIVQQVGCDDSPGDRGWGGIVSKVAAHGVTLQPTPSLPGSCYLHSLLQPTSLLEAGIVLLCVSKQQHPHLPPTHNRMCCGLMYV